MIDCVPAAYPPHESSYAKGVYNSASRRQRRMPTILKTCNALPVLVVASTCALATYCTSWPLLLPCLFTLSGMQLLLDMVVKSTPKGQVLVAQQSGVGVSSIKLPVVCKRLQGFHPDHHLEFKRIGGHWSAYILVAVSWAVTLYMHANIALSECLLDVLGLTILCYFVPLYTILLAYTGRDGNIHGFGLNVYAFLQCGGHRFEGERFLAIDWHPEKLVEQRADGSSVPRSEMRSVTWPHLHLCFWRLEFWPWDCQPTDAVAVAIAEKQKQRKEQRASAPVKMVTKDVDEQALTAAVELAASQDDITLRLVAGQPVRALAQDVAEKAVKTLLKDGEDGWLESKSLSDLEKCAAGPEDDPHTQRTALFVQLFQAAKGTAGRVVGRRSGNLRKQKKA